MDIRSYIDELFAYIDTFENQYAEFKTEAFIQTYNGIYAIFQALRKQRDKAINVDQYFLSKIQKSPLTSSDLRQTTLQVLITFFESEADIDGQSNKSYLYCRDLRASKRDIAFFEGQLLNLLFREGSLNNNFRLNLFLMKELARYLNKFGRDVDAGLTPESFDAMSDPVKFLELARRRISLGKELLTDRNSLEFHLHRIDAFLKLSKKSKLNNDYLQEWNYLKTTSFWSKVAEFFSEVWGKIKGAFASFAYFRLVMSQRSAAYGFYAVMIILFILLAFYVPNKWISYSEETLERFNQKASEIQGG
ncbi:MAG: hypothetical protein V3V99_11390 [candidate division Zixibacteria bacterium]